MGFMHTGSVDNNHLMIFGSMNSTETMARCLSRGRRNGKFFSHKSIEQSGFTRTWPTNKSHKSRPKRLWIDGALIDFHIIPLQTRPTSGQAGKEFAAQK